MSSFRSLIFCCLGLVLALSACSPFAGQANTPTSVAEGFQVAIATSQARNDQQSLAIIYYERANYAYGQGDFNTAIDDFQAVIAIEPTNARAYNNLGLAYAMLGRDEEAINAYNAAIEYDPDYLRAYKNRIVLLEKHKRLPELVSNYARLAELEPLQAGDYHYLRGVALRSLLDNQGARAAFDQALEVDPEQMDALYERGLLNFAEGYLPEAIWDFDQALRLSPRAANVYYARGLALQSLGRHDQAIDDFGQALVLQPDTPSFLLARASSLILMGKPTDASADLVRARAGQLDQTLQLVADTLERELERTQE
jgi:Flp pilus assembly protein TadD